MQERRTIKQLLLVSMVALSSCFYDSEEDLYPASDCNTTALSFQTNIAPIFQQNCFTCHSAIANTANVTLEGHGNVAQLAASGRLLGAIKHEPGFAKMPQGAAKLSDCSIAKIEQWVADGSPNN